MRSSPPTASGSSPATQASRANAVCERMIGTLRRELLDRILILNERHLRWILTIYLHHFNTARPHRTLGQLTPVQAYPGLRRSCGTGLPTLRQTHPARHAA
jgi:transposase InsO family protein